MLHQKSQPKATLSDAHYYREKLRNCDMKRVSDFICTEVGIQLPESKQTLVEGRLRKRLHMLGFRKFKDYLDHALSDDESRSERNHLIDAITTNKTEFFREPEHYEFLRTIALPLLEQNRSLERRKELYLWSAGCSTGEEAYTLSMIMHEAAVSIPDLRFKILASDISQSCVTKARRGIYTESHISPVSMDLRKKYLLKSKNPDHDLVCMGPEIRSKIIFMILNLIDKDFRFVNKMDVIFCRNVMIYFNKTICAELVGRFAENLVKGGYLFVGHAESLNGISTTLRQVAPMVYQKP